MAGRGVMRTRDRATLAWFVGLFFAAQAALAVGLDWRNPEASDPEFDVRLHLLRERIAENPGRPLLLMLGSSRTVGSFAPERLPPMPLADGQPPLVFNFSHLGAGPCMNLLELRRLLARGIRPTWLVVEVMPPQLGDDEQTILTSTASASDLSYVACYLNPWEVYGRYTRSRLVPWYRQRAYLMHRWLPRWLPPDAGPEQSRYAIGPLGGDYIWSTRPPITDDQIRLTTAEAKASYYPALHSFHIAAISDRAWHELLELCRREGIPVALVLTPEGSAFQSWYAPEARQLVDDYSGRLSVDYDLPLIDARGWLADDAFIDSHHVLPRGAQAFTDRLGRDVLPRVVRGTLPRPHDAMR